MRCQCCRKFHDEPSYVKLLRHLESEIRQLAFCRQPVELFERLEALAAVIRLELQ